MRRSDREITDFESVVGILSRCGILRLGLSDGEYPYIVPVNFAYTAENGVIKLYIHGARAGRKYELLRKNRVCSFEADNALGIVCNAERRSATERYESVMGKASAEFLDGAAKETAMDLIMQRYPETRDFSYDRGALEHTAVAELKVSEITAKANTVK